MIEEDLEQPVPFIRCSINVMKSLAIYSINKKMEGLAGRNVFSVGIYTKIFVKRVRLSQSYNVIVGGVNPKAFVCVDSMTKVEMHDRLEVIRSDENK